jgi:16S rRNA (cytosine1402-N4)-methyltransferase
MTSRGKGEAPEADGGLACHTPVLLPRVLEFLQPKSGERYIDCTFGASGYTRAILEAADCHVLALDRDPNAIRAGEPLVKHYTGRLTLVEAPFSELANIASQKGFTEVDGIVFDLGVSSMQLDEAERGFSFMRDGPLDMRMSGVGPSAADVVNQADEKELAEILFILGEERKSRAIARAILRNRELQPFTRTAQLAELIAGVLGRRRDDAKHPATRAFQALRLFVNDELGELVRGLEAAEHVLRPSGRIVVVTFHSLEDRIVKSFLSERAGGKGKPSRHLPDVSVLKAPSFALLNRKAIAPDEAEVAANPRARSARLRAAKRLEAAAWPVDARALGVPNLHAGTIRHRAYRTFTKYG